MTMDFSNPKQSLIIRRIAIIGSFILTLHWRLLYRNRITFGKNFICDWKFNISGPGKVTFGDNVLAWSRKEITTIQTYSPNAEITIGNNVRLNGCELQSQSAITIGDNSIIGSAVIVDTDFHSMHKDRATNPNAYVSTKPIYIKVNTWITGRCAILKGVTVGQNSVVGFGSVVREDVPENTLVMGNPAKEVKKLDP